LYAKQGRKSENKPEKLVKTIQTPFHVPINAFSM
jgi:hypothetical protein